MKVLVSDIKKEKSPIILKEEIKYLPEQYSHVFSLNKIKKVEVEAKCSNFGDIIEIYFEIKADLVLQCSYTLEDVDYLMDVNETLEFSFEPINEEIIEIEGNEIDLDEYVLSIIIANIPLRVIKKGAKLPSVDGVRVLSQDEFEEEKKNTLDPRLAALDDWEE
ncbi:MAG: DUF177 domain-containing protein [Erysipelotrichales bacterium]|nr:DUF177 domain-containing protein [Erysipelotrichales bacterium]